MATETVRCLVIGVTTAKPSLFEWVLLHELRTGSFESSQMILYQAEPGTVSRFCQYASRRNLSNDQTCLASGDTIKPKVGNGCCRLKATGFAVRTRFYAFRGAKRGQI